jgi:hypothetical protein
MKPARFDLNAAAKDRGGWWACGVAAPLHRDWRSTRRGLAPCTPGINTRISVDRSPYDPAGRDARLFRNRPEAGARMGQVRIPYYIIKSGRGFWNPTAAMKRLGFASVPCGQDGPDACRIADLECALAGLPRGREWSAVASGLAR